MLVEYHVKSFTTEDWYFVRKVNDEWQCNCPRATFKKRGTLPCKHILLICGIYEPN